MMNRDVDKSSIAPPDLLKLWLSLIISVIQISLWFAFLYWNLTSEIKIWLLPFQVLLQSFLFVGLFIVSHDCMHGIVGPEKLNMNCVLGSLSAFLFGGFSYQKLKEKHDKHHEYLVTDLDPDYTENKNENFFVWLTHFFKRYFGWREFLCLHLHIAVCYMLSGSLTKVIVFFAIPSWIGSLQLFYFGTYLPHRSFINNEIQDPSEMKARNIHFSTWLSFLTCYHFSYHLAHHKYPYLAWWRLPRAFRRRVSKDIRTLI